MEIILVTAKPNIASKNMYDLLVKEYEFKETGESFEDNKIHEKKIDGKTFKLIQSNKGILEIEYLKKHFSPDHYIILSTHKSEAETKSLSCHISGNWEEGVVPADANLLRNIFLKLQQKKIKVSEDYVVTLEVTHHQPFDFNAPSVWVEVGGTEKEWQDLDACRAVVESVLEVNYNNTASNKQFPTAVGFGGPHYAPNFMKDYVLNSYAVGHICSKHAIDSAKDNIMLDAFNKTIPKAKVAIIDWKGTNSAHRQRLTKFCEDNQIEWKKLQSLKG
jgi:D-aminoacyl-tRNA deacylase